MVLSKKRITKALIRLRGCAGWSAPLLFATLRRQVFSWRGPNNKRDLTWCIWRVPQFFIITIYDIIRTHNLISTYRAHPSWNCCLLLASAAYIHFRLHFFMEENSNYEPWSDCIYCKQYGPTSDCSLIWVHIVCNISYQKT